MLTIKFFQYNERYYAKARHNGIETDRKDFYNVSMEVMEYIKTVLTWGYSIEEITFQIDATCGEYEVEEIQRAIDILTEK